MVADFFAGSGTTATVAARLGRRFIASDAQWRAIHTIRSRFVQNAALLEKTGKKPPPLRMALQREEKAPEQMRQTRGDAVELRGNKLILNPNLAPKLDYWEVDPDWRGDLFRSVVQSARPRRKGDILTELELPFMGNQICVRLVNVNGDKLQEIVSL